MNSAAAVAVPVQPACPHAGEFPAEMPVESIRVVIRIVRARSIATERVEFLLHGLRLAGWLGGKAVPDLHRPIGNRGTATDLDCTEVLESLIADLLAPQFLGPQSATRLLAWLFRWLQI